jgi:hypothetical protein
MLQQFSAAGGGPPLLHGFDKSCLVFQHTVHRFLHHLYGIFASAAGNLGSPILIYESFDGRRPPRTCAGIEC